MELRKLEYQNNIPIDSILLSDDIEYIFDLMLKLPRRIKITIKLNPEKIYDINILEKICKLDSSVDIVYGFEYVPITKYIEVHKKLDQLVEPIINLDLSPLERYLYIYNITTHLKEYKEKEFYEDDALSLFRILDDDNDLIVCGGFAKVLFELGKRVKLDIKMINVNTYDISEDGYRLSSPHIRNIGRITDTKYCIDGIYIMDATWNNDLETELYTTALLTPMESTSTYCINIGTGAQDLFSSNSYEEFLHQLKKDSEYNFVTFKLTLNYMLYFYPMIKAYLNNIDSYVEFSFKKEKKYSDYKKLLSDSKFTSSFYQFIFQKCNKSIPSNVIMSALANLKRKITPNITEEEIQKYISITTSANYENYDDLFLVTKEYGEIYVCEYLTGEKRNKFKC